MGPANGIAPALCSLMAPLVRTATLAQTTPSATRKAWIVQVAALMILCLPAACRQLRPPPSSLSFGGLPVSGSLADALHAGFTTCIDFGSNMRCRRNGVMFEGQGPYDAAVDLEGGDGRGGFDQLTLWHDSDQSAVLAIKDELIRQGWNECFVNGKSGGNDNWGDQAIYTHKNSPVYVAMDISFWGKRRLRVIPTWNRRELRC